MRRFSGTLVYLQGGKKWLEAFPIVYNLMEKVISPIMPVSSSFSLSLPYPDTTATPSLYTSETATRGKNVRHFTFDSKLALHDGGEVTSFYNFIYYADKNLWEIDYQCNLHPTEVLDLFCDPIYADKNYTFEEIFNFYDLIKYLHLALDCEITAGSTPKGDYAFGHIISDSIKGPMGFHEILLFNKSGPCRLQRPYEDRINPYLAEEDPYKDTEHGDLLYSPTPLPIVVSDTFLETFDLPLPHLIPKTLPKE